MKVAALNADILGGELSIPKIAAKYYQNYYATLRHSQNHVSQVQFKPTLAANEVGVTDLLARYAAALADSDRVREFAISAQRPDLLLKAAASSRSAVQWLVEHLKITDLEVTAELDEYKQLERAIARVVAEAPEFGVVLSEQLEADGQRDLSAMVSDFARTSQLRLQQKRAEAS